MTVWFYRWTDEFNEYQDRIFAELEFIPGEALATRIQAARAAGEAPDVTYVNFTTPVASVPDRLLLPISDFLDASVWYDFYDNILDLLTAGDGKIYAMPHYAEPFSMLFYRKDHFAEVGLTDPPRTWDELREFARLLTTEDRFGFGLPEGAGDLAWTTWGWEAQFGFNLLNDDWSGSNIERPEFRALIELYKGLHEDGSVPPQAFGPFWDIRPLAEGNLSMQLNGSWSIGGILVDYADLGVGFDNIGFALAPTISGVQEGVATAAIGGWGFALDGMSRFPYEAAEYIAFMAGGDPQAGLEWAHATANSKFAVRSSVNELISADSAFADNPWTDLVMEQVVPYALPEPVYPWDISDIFARHLEAVIMGVETVDGAISLIDEEINNFIAFHELAGTNPRR
jgi:multiple sugar transport system substrate-binding protein